MALMLALQSIILVGIQVKCLPEALAADVGGGIQPGPSASLAAGIDTSMLIHDIKKARSVLNNSEKQKLIFIASGLFSLH